MLMLTAAVLMCVCQLWRSGELPRIIGSSFNKELNFLFSDVFSQTITASILEAKASFSNP